MKAWPAHVKTALAIVGCIAIAVWGFSFVMRDGLFPWKWEEVSRLASPSGEKELIVMRGNRGAMSGFRYAYYVVPGGESAPANSGWPTDANLIGTDPAPTARWSSDRHLTLFAKRGVLIFSYLPFSDARQVGVDVSHELPSEQPKA